MDIVAQLRADRSAQNVGTGEACTPWLLVAAANEIERLERLLEVRDQMANPVTHDLVQRVADAMQERAKHPVANLDSLEPVLVTCLGDAWKYLARAAIEAMREPQLWVHATI